VRKYHATTPRAPLDARRVGQLSVVFAERASGFSDCPSAPPNPVLSAGQDGATWSPIGRFAPTNCENPRGATPRQWPTRLRAVVRQYATLNSHEMGGRLFSQLFGSPAQCGMLAMKSAVAATMRRAMLPTMTSSRGKARSQPLCQRYPCRVPFLENADGHRWFSCRARRPSLGGRHAQPCPRTASGDLCRSRLLP